MRARAAVPILACLLAGPAAAQPAPAQAAGPLLAQHRAVYDLSLAGGSGTRSVEGARGRIVFDFTGDACEGYTLNFRQVTVLESGESGSRSSDMRNVTHEDGEGRSYRFRTEQTSNGAPSGTVAGEAETRGDGAVAVRLREPKRETAELPAGTVFPTAHMRLLLEAARAGRTTVNAPVFDGSDDGRKVYDTLGVIGRRIEPGKAEGLEEAARQEPLLKLARWPMTLSYYAPGDGERTPVYTLSFELYENGVSRALKLDYGDFALKGEMTRLDLIPDPGTCKR
jgi:hypothetical protein